jgi:hypothetical protein
MMFHRDGPELCFLKTLTSTQLRLNVLFMPIG